jgi:dehydrogenase/reductase SDR family protein 12
MTQTSPRAANLTDTVLEASIVGSFTRLGYEVRSRLLPEFTAGPLPSMTGQTVLITGATSGIGLAAATRLAALGAQVRFLARSHDRAERARDRIAAAAASAGHDPGLVGYQLGDLDDLDSVRQFAAEFTAGTGRLDVLIHNAGAMHSTLQRTQDGLELTVAGQLIAPFLLTHLLLGPLAASAPSRVITVSSGGMYTQPIDLAGLAAPSSSHYRGATAYAKVKRGQVALNALWAEQTRGSGIAFQAMHPGWTATPGIKQALPGFSGVMRPLLRPAAEGADTIVWLASADPGPLGSGRFWLDRRARPVYRHPGAPPDPPGAGQRLWDWVAEQAGLDPATAARPPASTASPASARPAEPPA